MRFVREVAILQGGTLIPILSGLVSSILYARLLGLGGYGQYAVVLAFTGVIGLFTNLGQRFTTLTFLAEAYGRKDAKAMRAVCQYYVVLSMFTIVLLGLFVLVLPSLTQWIYGNQDIGKLARIVFLASMFDPFFLFLALSLQTVREIRTLTLLENGYTLLQLTLGLTFILIGMGPAGILWGSALTSMFSAGIALILYPTIARRHGLPSVRDIVMHRGTKQFWSYVKNGMWIAVDKSVANLYPNLFFFLLSVRTQESVVGLIRLAYKFANLPTAYVLSNISRLASSLIPMLSAAGKKFGKDLIKLLRYTFALHIGVSLATAIVVPLLFPFIYGKTFMPALYPFWIILASQLLLPIYGLTTPLFRLYGKIHVATTFTSIGIAGGMGIFWLLTSLELPPTWALYGAIAFFQSMALPLLIPTLKMLRSVPVRAA